MRAHSRPMGPGPRTTTASPGRIVEFMHIALYDNGMRLRQARDVERQRVGDVVQASRRHPHPLRHRAVHAISKALARRTEIVSSGPAQHALAADFRRRFADDPIAFLEAAHGATEPRDRAAELVAEHDRNVHGPGVCVPRLMDVRSADGHRAHRQQRLVVCDVRDGDLAQLDGTRLAARSERRRTFSWQQSGVPGARRARAGVEVYRMDVVADPLEHGEQIPSPRDGTPRRRSRAAHRQRPAARPRTAHSIA